MCLCPGVGSLDLRHSGFGNLHFHFLSSWVNTIFRKPGDPQGHRGCRGVFPDALLQDHCAWFPQSVLRTVPSPRGQLKTMGNVRNLVWSPKSRVALKSHPSSTPHVGPAEGHHVVAIASSSRCCLILSLTERSAGRPCTASFLCTLLPLKALVPRNPIRRLTLDFSALFHRK
jgi:hypothetical protein